MDFLFGHTGCKHQEGGLRHFLRLHQVTQYGVLVVIDSRIQQSRKTKRGKSSAMVTNLKEPTPLMTKDAYLVRLSLLSEFRHIVHIETLKHLKRRVIQRIDTNHLRAAHNVIECISRVSDGIRHLGTTNNANDIGKLTIILADESIIQGRRFLHDRVRKHFLHPLFLEFIRNLLLDVLITGSTNQIERLRNDFRLVASTGNKNTTGAGRRSKL